jgi:hypothetical protein
LLCYHFLHAVTHNAFSIAWEICLTETTGISGLGYIHKLLIKFSSEIVFRCTNKFQILILINRPVIRLIFLNSEDGNKSFILFDSILCRICFCRLYCSKVGNVLEVLQSDTIEEIYGGFWDLLKWMYKV